MFVHELIDRLLELPEYRQVTLDPPLSRGLTPVPVLEVIDTGREVVLS